MKKIELKKGIHTIVDNDTSKEILTKKWYLWSARGKQYAFTNVFENGKRTTKQLHTFIMNTPKGMEVDHINGNGLDNRTSNLRLCTHAQNQANRLKNKNKKGFKGVYFDKRTSLNPYQAILRKGEKYYCLGNFKTEKEAAVAYNKKCIELNGQFACINII